MSSARGGSERRRGDVGELRALLKDAALERDAQLKRHVLRRVLALMTTGVDTAELFPGMLLALHTTDLVNKKLIYLYLTAHSRTNATLAMLCINTLVKECSDTSPLVRGLALRSLAALRVPSLLDYLLPILDRALADSAAYVRRMAVLCVGRVHARAREACVQRGYVRTLATTLLLHDADAQVSLNALHVLLDMAARTRRRQRRRSKALQQQQQQQQASNDDDDDVPFVVTRDVVYSFLRRLPSLRAWQQTAVVKLLAQHYDGPASEAEMYALMNVLEERLVTHDSGLLLACCSAFVRLTQHDAALQRQVLERLRQPLLSMMATCEHDEVAYVVLCHIRLLVHRDAQLFAPHYRDFYCRYSEPTYVQQAKMDVLARVATPQTAPEVLRELAAVACEQRNALTSTCAVQCIGMLAQRLPAVMAMPVQHCLVDLLALDVEHVRDAVLVVARDYLRSGCCCSDNNNNNNNNSRVERVQALLDAVAASAATAAEDSRSEESRLALLWVLGVYGEHIAEAPYLLEAMCSPQSLRLESARVCAQTLHTAMLLFAKRPPEMQRLLGSILHTLRHRTRSNNNNSRNEHSNSSNNSSANPSTTSSADTSSGSGVDIAVDADVDVADKAQLYYRLLRVSPVEAMRVVAAATNTTTTTTAETTRTFAEDDDVDVVDALMDELDTLSVVYGVPRRLRQHTRSTAATATRGRRRRRRGHGRHTTTTTASAASDDSDSSSDDACSAAADDVDSDDVDSDNNNDSTHRDDSVGAAASGVVHDGGAGAYVETDLMRAWCEHNDTTDGDGRDGSAAARRGASADDGHDAVSRIWPASATHTAHDNKNDNNNNNNEGVATLHVCEWLDDDAVATALTADAFEQRWRDMTDTHTLQLRLSAATTAASNSSSTRAAGAVATATASERGAEQLADYLQGYRLYVLAWGAQDDGSTKLYLYARARDSSNNDDGYMLVELRLSPHSHDVAHVTVRHNSHSDTNVQRLATTLRTALDAFASAS